MSRYSANKVINISNTPPSESNSPPTFTAAFIYGADGNRVVQSVGTGALGESARTVYVGLGGTGKSIYERTTYVKTGKKEHVHFVYAGGAHGGNAFALRVVTEDQSGDPPPPTTKYYHFDHLGSVTAISDDTGNVFGTTGGAATTLFGYDAWGVRRNPDGTPAGSSLSLQVGHREFTSHETVPNVGLVNMNGRVYDPDLGRFLTPDPNVQAVANLQSYNRYSYVLNNPLRYTDPTGYAWYSFLTSPSFWIGMYESVVTAAACASTGGAGCLVLTGFMIAQMAMTSTAAILDGAPWQQVLKGDSIALGGMLVGLGAPADASPLARLLGGAVGGGVTAAVGTVLMGGNMDQLGQNALAGAMTGAVAAGVASAVQGQNPLSLRTAAESQGGGGSGAEKNEMIQQGRTIAGASYGQDGGDKTLLMWNDIEYSDRQQALIDRNQGAFEAKLMDLVGHNLDVDMGNTTVIRVSDVEGIDAALNSGDYSRVVYFGHTVGGELTPTLGQAGMDPELFKFLMPDSVREIDVYGCESAQFTGKLYDPTRQLGVGGMQGDLFDTVTNGVIQNMYTGTRNNPTGIGLYRY